jgi:hypothetical protein
MLFSFCLTNCLVGFKKALSKQTQFGQNKNEKSCRDRARPHGVSVPLEKPASEAGGVSLDRAAPPD